MGHRAELYDILIRRAMCLEFSAEWLMAYCKIGLGVVMWFWRSGKEVGRVCLSMKAWLALSMAYM